MGQRKSSLNSTRKRQIRRELFKRHPLCHLCGMGLKLSEATLEHKIPLAAGGSDHISNLALAHPRCNSRRGMGTY